MSGGKDPCWKYATPDRNDRNTVICNFCGKQTKGGIFRAKKHLVGGFRDATKCPRCPASVRAEIASYMKKKKAKVKESQCSLPLAKVKEEMVMTSFSNNVDDFGSDEFDVDKAFGFDEYEEDQGFAFDEYDEEEDTDSSGDELPFKRLKASSFKGGPMDAFLTVKTEVESNYAKTDELEKNDRRQEAVEKLARWFYVTGIRLDVVEDPSFQQFWDALCMCGQGPLKPPTAYELKVPFLRNEKRKIDAILESHKEEWRKYGCALILDGWRDEVEKKDILNVLVYSPKGMVFLMSKDVSGSVNDAQKLSLVFDTMVENVGEENVVQVVTDNASTYAAAGKLLEMQRRHLFWSPCATHCIDLMLEDIGRFPRIREAIKKAVFLNYYLYNQIGIPNLLRKYTGKRELLRGAVTRFATTFITFKSIYEQKYNLRKMVVSDEWRKKKWSKEGEAKKCVRIVLMESFWRDVVYALKLTIPLVKVLALVYSDKPSMGHIYGAIDQAKEAIKKSFNHNEERYKEAIEIIDNRWQCQLNQPLHAAAYFLNPRVFCDNRQAILENSDIMNGFHLCIERLVRSQDEKAAIKVELPMYQNAESIFGNDIVIRPSKRRSPVNWWEQYGSVVPHLKKFAISILSLTCSATRHEKKWDTFQQIHSKRMIGLERSRLKKLLFVRYNLSFFCRHDSKNEIDPLLVTDIDDDNEWLSGIMEDDDEDGVSEIHDVQESDWIRGILRDNDEDEELDLDEEPDEEGEDGFDLELHLFSDDEDDLLDEDDGF